MRQGLTLLETIVALTIVGVLLALLLPAVQTVRASADQHDDRNKMRQMGIALHQYSAAMDGRLPGTQVPSVVAGIFANNSPHFNLLPFLEPEFPYPYYEWVAFHGVNYFTTKSYISKSDPTISDPRWTINTGWGATSFPANSILFSGRPLLYSSAPDGHSTTAWLSQRYIRTELRHNYTTHVYLHPSYSEGTEYQSDRSCTFADKEWDDVVPIAVAGGSGRTLPSKESVTFQHRPDPAVSDGSRLQSFHRSGLLLGMLDGGVRTISPGIEPSTFWALITPNGGEIAE